ncbi:hypothetical protein [Streptomyces sp. NEAU-S7GS2]|uniref:hypothetical protein n=1 Tax=Streptomyces sp. NEAU-S7GS2 TaxID=2202000 RepID=UPI000D6F6B5D|nr:hypothetical protein [Streptomyces sp. NEAU-S7GS2]AWN32626.1 hypothetical protein DKG71_42370 [Streptomyces sp. NEAU-S7GS2]
MFCHAECPTADVLAALGLKWPDLFDDPMPEEKKTFRRIPRARGTGTKAKADTKAAPKKKAKKPTCTGRFVEVARYAYVTVEGEIVGHKIRRECTGCAVCRADGAKPAKRIVWKRTADNGTGTEWSMPENPPLYRAPELAAAPKGSTVYLGEGERVVEAAEELGLLATTKPGSGSSRWDPDHTPLLAGQHVVILADRDTAGYKSAREARDALLADAASVTVLQTPVEIKGADLVEHRAAGLGVDDLIPVPELDDAEIITHPTAQDTERPDTPAADSLSEGEPIPGDKGQPNRRDEFVIRHGEIVKVTRRPAGEDEDGRPQFDVTFDTVLGCSATIIRVETRDLGEASTDKPRHTGSRAAADEDQDQALADVEEPQPTTGYVLQLVHPKRLDQPALMRVTRKAFDEGSWLHDLPWTDVYYRPATRTNVAQIATAIRAVSPDAIRIPVYAATGWRHTDAGWMYVHADGGITTAGHVPLRTRFPGRLSLMGLPAPTTDPDRIRAAVEDSLSIPAHTPEFATVAMMGLLFRAPFGRCPSSICLFGLPGSGKTGVGTIVLRHFAPELDRNESLLSISDTGSTQLGTTEVLYRMKDALVMGDDSAPDKSVKDASVRTSRMGRTQYNGEGRVRMKQVDGELELDDQRGPRGSLIQTSEVLASTESAQQRMLTIQMSRAEIDIDQLARMSAPEFAANCALLMASYIQWIAANYEQHTVTVRKLANDYASQLRPYAGDRPAEHLGQFATGWHMLLRYLVETGVATPEETAGWWTTAWNALLDACDRERNLLENATMHRRLLGYLATALHGKHAHLVGPDGKCPATQDTALRYGWSVLDNSAEDPANPGRPVLRAGGVQLGVVTTEKGPDGKPEQRLWLDHQQATRIALRMAAELQESFTVTSTVLTEALRQAGVIAVEWETVKKGRWVKARRPMPGGRRRVWDMPASALDEGSGGDDDPGQGAGPARPPAPPAPQADPLFDLSVLTTPATSTEEPTAPAAPAPPAQPELPTQQAAPQAPAAAPAPVPTVTTPPAAADDEHGATAVPTSQADELHAQEPDDGPAPDEDDEREPTVTTPWRAAVAVADVDGLHFPDGEVKPLPPLAELHAGRFAQLVDELGLGHGGAARGSGASAKHRPDDGQIYITTALAEALQLPIPEDGPADERRAYLAEHLTHPFLARAQAEGWTVNRWGAPLRIWRERPDGGRNISAQLVIVPHVLPFGDRFLEDDPTPVLLAKRVQQLADTIGVTYRRSAGATGHELLQALRPRSGRRADPLVRTETPKVLMERRNLYVAKVWDRQPTQEELKRRYILAFDTRASYLPVCSSLAVGRGAVEHRTGKVEFDPKIPGMWLAKMPAWDNWMTFDPFGPRPADGEMRLYATPTLAYAQKDLGADIEVAEAWVWPDHYRMLEPWYRQLSTARKTLAPTTDETVTATLKDCYTHSIGLFNSDHLRGNPKTGTPDAVTFMPYVQQAAMAAQQANLTRAIVRVGKEAGLWPIAAKTDCLFYVVDDPDFTTAVPGLKMEDKLGHFKPEGAALAEDIFAKLRPGKNWFPTASAFTAPEDWRAV